LPTMLGSDVAIHLSTKVLESDVREAAVANQGSRCPQLDSPGTNAPLTVLPKAIRKNFSSFPFGRLSGGKVVPSDDVLQIVGIELSQNQVGRFQRWHMQLAVSHAHAHPALNPAPQCIHTRPARK